MMVKQLWMLVLLAVLLALASCDQSAGKTEAALREAAIARCEQAVREEAENPQSVSFGEILRDHVEEWPERNAWNLYGAFTQQVGDRFAVPHFYSCIIVEEGYMAFRVLTGHAADYDQTASRSICRQAIARRSEFPDRADFKPDGAKYDWGSLPHFTFQGTVDLMNSLSEMIPYDYFCDIDHGEITSLKLTEKD